MRFRLLAQTLLSAGAALASPFAQLPASSFPDTEVSTNVPFLFRRDHAGRFNFALDFNATPSNNVEVAFGSDLDADGVLQPRETALSFAWDCGQWILGRGPADPVLVSPSATNDVRKSVAWSLRLFRGATPRRLALSENGRPLFPELALEPPAGLFCGDWNLVRVTARGVDAPEESLSVVVQSDSFIFRLR
ncbi:MAG: hypothetical protein PUE68_09925 [Kiritimatiellae bacterium]|nr:hypothetical protein [Kiritimatiellia bacterium]